MKDFGPKLLAGWEIRQLGLYLLCIAGACLGIRTTYGRLEILSAHARDHR
jgi:hypothetical protein